MLLVTLYIVGLCFLFTSLYFLVFSTILIMNIQKGSPPKSVFTLLNVNMFLKVCTEREFLARNYN